MMPMQKNRCIDESYKVVVVVVVVTTNGYFLFPMANSANILKERCLYVCVYACVCVCACVYLCARFSKRHILCVGFMFMFIVIISL